MSIELKKLHAAFQELKNYFQQQGEEEIESSPELQSLMKTETDAQLTVLESVKTLSAARKAVAKFN